VRDFRVQHLLEISKFQWDVLLFSHWTHPSAAT